MSAPWHASIAADAAYDSFTLVTGARLARSEIHARLDRPRSHAALNAAQVLRGPPSTAISPRVVSHDAPSGTSRQTVKNVLDGHARGVFQGKIEVARAAQKTDGYQMNQALLAVARRTKSTASRKLEIFADDVKCSHGATVGELDADQLFYLISRGIPRPRRVACWCARSWPEALALVQHDSARALFEGKSASLVAGTRLHEPDQPDAACACIGCRPRATGFSDFGANRARQAPGVPR
ncbi:MAG: SufD family Fe-S cluster assembly protein [Rhodospirillales bacterium]